MTILRGVLLWMLKATSTWLGKPAAPCPTWRVWVGLMPSFASTAKTVALSGRASSARMISTKYGISLQAGMETFIW